jgi:hypothetical protein
MQGRGEETALRLQDQNELGTFDSMISTKPQVVVTNHGGRSRQNMIRPAVTFCVVTSRRAPDSIVSYRNSKTSSNRWLATVKCKVNVKVPVVVAVLAVIVLLKVLHVSSWPAEDRKTGRPEDRKTGRPEDRKTGRPEDRKTGRPEDVDQIKVDLELLQSARQRVAASRLLVSFAVGDSGFALVVNRLSSFLTNASNSARSRSDARAHSLHLPNGLFVQAARREKEIFHQLRDRWGTIVPMDRPGGTCSASLVPTGPEATTWDFLRRGVAQKRRKISSPDACAFRPNDCCSYRYQYSLS